MGAQLRVLFIGRFRYNSGSSHTLLGYVRAARSLNIDLRASLLGLVDSTVRSLVPVAEEGWRPDVLVMVFESERFLDQDSVRLVERLAPRSYRLIVDPDGKFSKHVRRGSDTNHPTPDSRVYWTELYNRLSDVILQPGLGPVEVGAQKFLYFGIDLHYPEINTTRRKTFDLIYVGNNWYRWHDLVWLLNKVAPIRQTLGRIAVFGKDWNVASVPGFEQAVYSEPGLLTERGVEVFDSAPFGAVVRTMGAGRLHPIFIRPVLNALGFVTPRMFETFAADTVPLIPPYFRYAALLFGAESNALRLPAEPADTILNMLDKYAEYSAIARETRSLLIEKHSYEVRLKELLSFVR